MAKLGIFLDERGKERRPKFPEDHGNFEFDGEDYLLYALLCDNVYCPELLWEDAKNRDTGGVFQVRDYQYPLFRVEVCYAGFACARNTGKTESIKAKSFTHTFKRMGEERLLSAPELIHLLPLTDAIEDRIQATRLTREFLDTRGGKTGFTHRPFGVDYLDGTKLIGRIPRLTGPQPLDAKVLAPDGWATMGELQPGDTVIGANGEQRHVAAVTNAWRAPVYRVDFTDGTWTRTDERHRWLVRTDSQDWSIRTTAQIASALLGEPKHTGGPLNMYRVPQQGVVQYGPERELPLDPYLLGALLGDGAISAKHAQLCSVDSEVVERVRAGLPPDHSLTPVGDRGIHYLLVGPGRHKPNRVLGALRELELLGCNSHTKFIPERYLRSSSAQRLELLRGLLDTDGSAKHGGAHLVSASRDLAEGAAEIARSLGGWASVGRESRHSGGVYWRTTIRIRGANVFHLPRKAARYRVNGKQRHRSIRAVMELGEAEVRCIEVDAPDESYLTDYMIPTLNTGVKGMHAPDVTIDEGQDYPEKGWTEIHEVVMKDHLDAEGEPDFRYEFYGVHSGARDTGFYKRTTQGGFKVVQITALQRPGWGSAEKQAAIAAYGGSSSPDYRRNILGEPGAAASPLFVSARLVACMDQDRESSYNTRGYKHQEVRVEEFDELMLPIADVLDLPAGLKRVWVGMDLGLTIAPTVILIFSEEKVKSAMRLRLVRRITMWRMRTKQIRHALYAIGNTYGLSLMGIGLDETGIGFPLFQEMEDDEVAPPGMMSRTRGWFFNSKVPVGVAPEHVTKDSQGNLRDQYGTAVEEVTLPTGEVMYVVSMPMVEASTRYLREFVDTTYFEFPFDPAVIGDMQGDTAQRLKRIVGLKNKPNAFHILDAMRGMAMIYKSESVDAQLAIPKAPAVLDLAMDASTDVESPWAEAPS